MRPVVGNSTTPNFVGGSGSPLQGVLTWDVGLGAITHILGPGDEAFIIDAQERIEVRDTLGINTTSTKVFHAIDTAGTLEFQIDGYSAVANLCALRFKRTGGGTPAWSNWVTGADGAGFAFHSNLDPTDHILVGGTTRGTHGNTSRGSVTVEMLAAASDNSEFNVSLADAGTGVVTPTKCFSITADGGVRTHCSRYKSHTDIDNTDSPYSVLDVDHIILVDTSTAVVTVNLPAVASSEGREIIVKDKTGDAATYNVTIDGNAAENIDGAATLTLVTAYQSITLYCDGTEWLII